MVRSASIPSLLKRSNLLFFVVLYYFVVLVLTDEERLSKCLTKIGDAHLRGFVGRLAEAVRNHSNKQKSDQPMLCSSIVPGLVPQIWFAMTFLRMPFPRTLALIAYVVSTYLVSSVLLETGIWKNTDSAIMELCCLLWASATALYTTRKNEVLTRYHFMKHFSMVARSPKKFSMSLNRNTFLQSSSLNHSASSRSSRGENASGWPWRLLMPHERDLLASSMNFDAFCDEDAEEDFMLHLWEDAQNWISKTGWLMSVVFVLLTLVDWGQEGFQLRSTPISNQDASLGVFCFLSLSGEKSCLDQIKAIITLGKHLSFLYLYLSSQC